MSSLLDDKDSRLGPDEDARPAPARSVTRRALRVATDRWIDYPGATKILQRLEELRTQGPGPNKRNLLLVGPDNNGKSALARRFAAQHPPRLVAAGGASIPVLVLPAPPVLNRTRFIYGIHEVLFAPYTSRGPHQLAFLDTLDMRTLRLLQYINLETLVIDDLHHALACSEANRERFFDALRRTVPENVSIAATATEEDTPALRAHPEVRKRFEVVRLPRWRMGSDYLRFLGDLGRALPSGGPSNLAEPRTAKAILKAAGGTIGGIVSAVVGAAYRDVGSAG